MKAKFLILFLAIFPELLFAQLYFKNYQVDEGLSSNTITIIFQDKNGFIWLGTRNGLNRFDGYHFRGYKNDKNDPLSIGSHSISALCDDEEGRLWIGTYDGIYRYDYTTDGFIQISAEYQFIQDLTRDAGNNIWFISGQKLYKIENSLKPQKPKAIPIKLGDAVSLNINSGRNELWIADSRGNIGKYNLKGEEIASYNTTAINNGLPINTIKKIHTINDSTALLGTMNNLYLFRMHQQSLEPLLPGKKSYQVHTILHEKEKIYWIGTETGLYIYNLSDQTLREIQKEYGNPYALTDNVVYALHKDREGGIWIGTFSGGINYYSPDLNRFAKYYPNAGRNHISGNIVHEICEDDYGNIWIGTEDGGVNKLNRKSGQISSYLPGKGQGSISYQNIHGLIAAGNELWIGTYEHGLDVMDIRTGKVIRHYNTETYPGKLNGNFIVSLYRSPDNKVLVGTWNGLMEYDRKHDQFIADTFFTIPIQSMITDHNNIFWVASYGEGVYWRNNNTGETGKIRHDPSKKEGLISNFVNNVYQDSKKNIWFCTESGLVKMDYATRKFTPVKTGDLTDYQVFRIIEDDFGKYWITTSKGLIYIDEEKEKIKLFTTADGLLSEQFNYNSAHKGSDGRIYFGSVKGMISFNPAEYKDPAYSAPVFITAIRINNKEYKRHHQSDPRYASVISAKSITLPYDSSNIVFDVACLSYITPEKNEYLYKMEGVDPDWIYLNNNRSIYYTKLPPGYYTFTVKGGRSVEGENISSAKIQLIILPPWYQSNMAILSYILIALGIVYLILRYYYLAVNEKNKRKFEILERAKEREVHHAKIEFFTHIAHEIRTPLTLIKLPLDKLIAELNAHPLYGENLNMMKKNTQRLIELTDQLLDFRKAEAEKFKLNFVKTDINALIKETTGEFLPAAEQRNLNLRLEMPRVSLYAFIDPEAFRKIISNLINNAVKYADKNIVVKLYPFNSDAEYFETGIISDGPQIPENLKERIFEPFYRIKDSQKQPGTGIGLSLAKSLAELHNGKLELSNEGITENRFLLTIPIHQEEEIILETEEEDRKAAATPEHEDDGKIKILIVEDQKEIVSFLQQELKDEFGIFPAYNGKEALEILEKENISLIISDIMMPVMDGIELTKRIKRDLQFSHIPVVLLTAKNSLDSKIEGLEAGADAYIEKPFSLEHLTAQINNLLANRLMIREYFSKSVPAPIKSVSISQPDKEFIETLHRKIYENLSDPALDVDSLSRMMNMSRSTFYRKIKSISDLTPNELIMMSRLKKAAELLLEGKYIIKEVVMMVGYSNSSNFSRDFSRHFGMSPSQYISVHKNQQAN